MSAREYIYSSQFMRVDSYVNMWQLVVSKTPTAEEDFSGRWSEGEEVQASVVKYFTRHTHKDTKRNVSSQDNISTELLLAQQMVIPEYSLLHLRFMTHPASQNTGNETRRVEQGYFPDGVDDSLSQCNTQALLQMVMGQDQR